MKLVTYESHTGPRPGIVHQDTVVDLNQALAEGGAASAGELPSMRAFLEAYGGRLAGIAEALTAVLERRSTPVVGSLSQVRLGPPVPNPHKVLCVGLNYSDHVGETGRAMPVYPDIFSKFATSLIGPRDAIARSEVSDNLDFEGELAMVIGKRCSRVGKDDALSHVAGLSVFNDITARDLQYRGTQWLPGKALDRATPFGPSIVTLDEVGDPHTLGIRTLVNGEQVQGSNTRHMIFPIGEIVSYISQFLTLNPGDVIATGTPEGIGAKQIPPQWLGPGDVVEVAVEKVGVLRNRIQ